MRVRPALAAVLVLALAAGGQPADRPSWVGGRVHQGEALDVDLPEREQIQNIGAKVDEHGRPTAKGDGMCVMSSIEMSFRWAGQEQMRGLRDWCANEPGGANARKTADQIKRFCAAKAIPVPPYVQYEGPDPGPVIEAALRSGRMACITYGWSPRYKDEWGQVPRYIPHMVSCVKGTGRAGAVLDNNFVGTYEWMPIPELVRRCKHPERAGWVFVPLAPPPPPSPRN